MIINNFSPIHSGKDLAASTGFESMYIASREKEGRLYTDEQVRMLPVIDRVHPHYQEWLLRKKSAGRLLQYLQKKNQPLAILEAGCGNGWLSNMLLAINGAAITGSDINQTELAQAIRVFGGKPPLDFVRAGIGSGHFQQRKFNIILFAASIQYFPNFETTMRQALSLLQPGGEIHIMDSQFYAPATVHAARKRSEAHYRSLGYAGMAAFYYHHSTDVLHRFNCTWLLNPSGYMHKLFRRPAAFPWLRIVPS